MFRLLAILVVILLVACGVWYFEHSRSNVSAAHAGSTPNPYSTLVSNNQYFVQAQAAASAGNYQQAQQLYQQALSASTDPGQQAQIQYALAQLLGKYVSPIQAIDLYKQIVANSSYDQSVTIKADSLMAMAELYYDNGNPAVTAEIFKDAPYSAMLVPGKVGLSYRHLEEYAVSFFPVGLSELRIATWYASNITDATSTPDGSATSTYAAIINTDISLADADITRTKTDTHAAELIPFILVRKEALYVIMYQAHIASAQDTEQACQAAIAMFASIGEPTSDGMARYYYAVFLSLQGPTRVTDLQSVLAPLYSNSGYKGTEALSFFASEKSNALGQKSRLVTLASLDPKFKALLLSLGWNETDFQ